MRIFNDSSLIQAFIDGGVHMHLIRSWLRDQGYQSLSESQLIEVSHGKYQVMTSPTIYFLLEKATPSEPHPQIIAIEIDGVHLPIGQNNIILDSLCQKLNKDAVKIAYSQ